MKSLIVILMLWLWPIVAIADIRDEANEALNNYKAHLARIQATLPTALPPIPYVATTPPPPSTTDTALQILTPVLIGALGVFLTALAKRGITLFEKYTDIQLTDQQRQAIYNSIETAKGQLETKLDQGLVHLASIDVDHPLEHPIVQRLTHDALARVPEASAAQRVTPETAAAIIVGRANTKPIPPLVLQNIQGTQP